MKGRMNNGALKNYAVCERNTRGRFFDEPKKWYRDDFDRDRDRIIHSGSFRRLEGKTQVFTPGLNDHYRTRLTHTIEVSQIGRTIAKYLAVNEALTEAICLSHDLGHSPFGHSGESALDKIMADYGGFEHNKQTLRIVELIEAPYPSFPGLNLLYETRLGIAKHKSTYDFSAVETFKEPVSSIEGQIADIADRIAYNCHDFEDGLYAKGNSLIDMPRLWELEIVEQAVEAVEAEKISSSSVRNVRVAKAMMNMLVVDVIETSLERLKEAKIETLEDVYRCEEVVVLSPKVEGQLRELEKFLYKNMYCSERLLAVGANVERWLKEIMDYYVSKPKKMPGYYCSFIERWGLERAVCDYVSGMTDRFALEILKKIQKCG